MSAATLAFDSFCNFPEGGNLSGKQIYQCCRQSDYNTEARILLGSPHAASLGVTAQSTKLNLITRLCAHMIVISVPSSSTVASRQKLSAAVLKSHLREATQGQSASCALQLSCVKQIIITCKVKLVGLESL